LVFGFIAIAALPQRVFSEDKSPRLTVGGHLINHVFIITLENKGYDETFGENSEAPYLAHDLTAQGVLLKQYYGIGHASLDNYIAMISGQAATKETRDDCRTFADFVVDTTDKKHPNGKTDYDQLIGHGCVYPNTLPTLANQLENNGMSWHGYMEDMGNDPRRESATCGHPMIDRDDHTQKAEAPSIVIPRGDGYAARHNPFVYFHSIIDHQKDCDANVVNLDHLVQDLNSLATTANFIFITPNLCNDAHDARCADGGPGGLPAADIFLRKWVPIITRSPAYINDGLLIINFDEADFDERSTSPSGVTTLTEYGESCCNEQPGPNIGSFPHQEQSGTTIYATKNFGGDRTGAVLLSPFLKEGSIANTPFNHYSMLKTIEDLFGLDYLGYAGQPGLIGFFGCVSSDVAVKDDPKADPCKIK
jgi:hypothetical protein